MSKDFDQVTKALHGCAVDPGEKTPLAPPTANDETMTLARLNSVSLVSARAAKLIYLAVTSRLLDRPVSVAVKGPSSGGKSFVVETTLKLFPPAAFYSLTAMSDRALAYSNESRYLKKLAADVRLPLAAWFRQQ